jgi:hypothetical protein
MSPVDLKIGNFTPNVLANPTGYLAAPVASIVVDVPNNDLEVLVADDKVVTNPTLSSGVADIAEVDMVVAVSARLSVVLVAAVIIVAMVVFGTVS